MAASPNLPFDRLPRGPHSLSRAEVTGSQRQRILDAAAMCVAEQGYVATSVADILGRAKVSRTTFYEQFSDKRECFVAACEHASVALLAAISEAEADADLTPLERLDALLQRYLSAIAAAPELARVFLVEVYAAGPEAIRLRATMLEVFADLVAQTHRGEAGLLGTEPHQRFAAETLVGAVSSMVTNAVGIGDGARVGRLRAPLMDLAAQLLSVPVDR